MLKRSNTAKADRIEGEPIEANLSFFYTEMKPKSTKHTETGRKIHQNRVHFIPPIQAEGTVPATSHATSTE
jgi:hypothetical protein